MPPQIQFRDPADGAARMVQTDTNDDLVIMDGAGVTELRKLIAPDRHLFQDLPISDAIGGALATKISGTCPALVGGQYEVIYSFTYNSNNGGVDSIFYGEVDEGAGFVGITATSAAEIVRQEPKDIGGNRDGTSSQQAMVGYFRCFRTYAAGDTPTFRLQFEVEGNNIGHKVSVWDASITVERWSA